MIANMCLNFLNKFSLSLFFVIQQFELFAMIYIFNGRNIINTGTPEIHTCFF